MSEDLLNELAWLRRLAGSLARDGAGDDLAQDALEVAVREQPEKRASLRPWLAEVLRRLQHTRARSFARRRDRESDLPADEPATPESLLERAELLRVVGQLVGDLDEPERSTVLLRYYEGLSAAEIAARQNVPAGTVRWRLKQGLDRLRARLDERPGGRRAWSALFTPFAQGGSTMIATVKLAAAIGSIVLVGAAGTTWVRTHHATGRARSSAPARVVAQVAPLPSTAPPANGWRETAQQAYVHGQYADAIEEARKHVDEAPGTAWRIIGASSCFLQDAHGAGQAWSQLDPTGKQFIEYVCSRNQVSIPDAKQVL
jgi:RNA polymerase sigma factor (sigma-70 family)